MQTFQVPLTRALLEQKRAEAAQKGFSLVGDSGKMNVKGVALEYTYDQAVLTINVLQVSLADKLAGYTEEHVAQMLKDMLTA